MSGGATRLSFQGEWEMTVTYCLSLWIGRAERAPQNFHRSGGDDEQRVGSRGGVDLGLKIGDRRAERGLGNRRTSMC